MIEIKEYENYNINFLEIDDNIYIIIENQYIL